MDQKSIRPVVNAVHTAHPLHLICRFQRLVTLSSFYKNVFAKNIKKYRLSGKNSGIKGREPYMEFIGSNAESMAENRVREREGKERSGEKLVKINKNVFVNPVASRRKMGFYCV